ncbi:MAG: DUF4105 domain-containing protein [Gemmatimonadales bacterium]
MSRGVRISRRRRWALGAGAVVLTWAVFLLVTCPSNDRDWTPNERVLPFAEFAGDSVRIHNIRDTRYRSATDYTPAYYDRAFDLRDLESLWFVVAPFSRWRGVAHTFLSFGFRGPDGPRYVAISVEARKERGETYHFLKGLFRWYELIYVVADERDVIRLRTDHFGEDVYLFPMRATPARLRQLFTAMLARANRLRERPEFYNTLTQNCTNTIAHHVNSLVPGRVPFSLNVVFPGYADRLAYDLGLIATELPYDSIRPRFRITERARAAGDAPDFSRRIRREATDASPPPRLR